MTVLRIQSLNAGCHGEFGSLFKTKTQTPKPKTSKIYMYNVEGVKGTNKLTSFMYNIPRMDFITSNFKF